MKLYERKNGKVVRTREIMMADYAIVKTIEDLNRLIANWSWHMPAEERDEDWRFGFNTFEALEKGQKVFCYRGSRFCTTSIVNDFRG